MFTGLLVLVGALYSCLTWGLFKETQKMRLNANRPYIFSSYKKWGGGWSFENFQADSMVMSKDKVKPREFIESLKLTIIPVFRYENISDHPAFNLTVQRYLSNKKIKISIPDSIEYNLLKPGQDDTVMVCIPYQGKGFHELSDIHLIATYYFQDQELYNYTVYRIRPRFSADVHPDSLYPRDSMWYIFKNHFNFEFEMVYQINGTLN